MFLGMRGTREWVANQRPESWREQILYLYPNGMAPLTAILSMLSSEQVDDPRFHWWTQTQSAVMGAIAAGDIFTDAACLLPYAPPPIAPVNFPLFVRITTVLANRIREGHQILLRCAADYSVDVVAKVTGVNRGAVTSIVAIKLLEADDNSTMVPANDLADADNFKIIGNMNPEGGEMPDAIALNPVEVDNYTQIFRTHCPSHELQRRLVFALVINTRRPRLRLWKCTLGKWNWRFCGVFPLATSVTMVNLNEPLWV